MVGRNRRPTYATSPSMLGADENAAVEQQSRGVRRSICLGVNLPADIEPVMMNLPVPGS
jgi:hypothetical protein